MSTIENYIETRAAALDSLLNPIINSLRENELRDIEASGLAQKGIAVLDFAFGEVGIRYFASHYTYCFIPLVRELGKLYSTASNNGWLEDNTRLPINFQLSIESTVSKFLVKRFYEEADYGITEESYYRHVRKTFKSMGHKTGPLIQSLRRELPTWFHLGRWVASTNFVIHRTVNRNDRVVVSKTAGRRHYR